MSAFIAAAQASYASRVASQLVIRSAVMTTGTMAGAGQGRRSSAGGRSRMYSIWISGSGGAGVVEQPPKIIRNGKIQVGAHFFIRGSELSNG